MNDITRRTLLKSAALGSAAVAALGATAALADEAPAAEDDALAGKHTWEVKPDPIPADQIVETIDTEVLVIGGGYSGTCCACNAAQNGAKVILVEKDDKLYGNGVGGTGAVGSRALDEAGVVIDKPLEMERWVATCGNRCRESLVGKWFRESERCMNWLLDVAESDGASCMVTVAAAAPATPQLNPSTKMTSMTILVIVAQIRKNSGRRESPTARRMPDPTL